MFKVIWLLDAAVVALGIALDMRRLRINRVGLGRRGWLLASVCGGPVAGAAYLVLRRAAWRALVAAVWQGVGDASHPTHIRRARLVALHRSGLVGEPVFRACLRTLDAGNPSTKA